MGKSNKKNKVASASMRSKYAETTLRNVVDSYDIIDVVPSGEDHGPFVVVTQKNTFDPFLMGDIKTEPTDFNADIAQSKASQQAVVTLEGAPGPVLLKEQPNTTEMGTSEASPYTAFFRKEYNRDLQGLRGFQMLDKMRKSDGVISGLLLTIKTPVMAGRWFIKPSERSKKNDKISDFVWNVLTDYMSISWTQLLEESMASADFGVWIWHKVWEIKEIKGKPMVVLKKLAPRHPMDIKEVKYDEHGGPKGIVFYSKVKESSGAVKEIFIPIEDLLVITFKREAGDILGTSILRPAYKHWYFKDQLYKIDAIQKERHGIGIPVIKLPPGFTKDDVTNANALGRNLRANDRAHIVLPPNWEIEFAKLQGNPVDCIKSIEHHNDMIRESVLASFTGSNTPTKEEDMSLFLKATRFIATSICDAFNLYLIPDIVKYNFDGITEFPKLTVRQIGEQADMRTFSYALRNLIGAGVVRPDDKLEEYVRELMDMPEVDLATVRVVKTPQAGNPVAPGALPNATPGTKTELPNDPNATNGKKDGTGKEDPATNTPGLPRQTPLPNIGVGGAGVGQGKGQV